MENTNGKLSFKIVKDFLKKRDRSMLLKCGPDCPIYEVAGHRCGISKNAKIRNSSCDFKLTVVEGAALEKIQR